MLLYVTFSCDRKAGSVSAGTNTACMDQLTLNPMLRRRAMYCALEIARKCAAVMGRVISISLAVCCSVFLLYRPMWFAYLSGAYAETL